jgi:DNA-nicking Smr family endonuclease
VFTRDCRNAKDDVLIVIPFPLLIIFVLARDGSLTCDLHGLTVAEAVSAVHIILRGVTTAGPSMGPATSYVRFVTGQGLHSQGKARLRPVVGRELQKAGYKVHSEAGAWIAALK